MDKFLLSSPALSHMEIDNSTAVQRNMAGSLYDTSGLGVGFSPDSDHHKSGKSQENSPAASHSLTMSSFDNSRNLSFIQETQPINLHDEGLFQETQSLQQQVSQQYQQLSNQFQQNQQNLQQNYSQSQQNPSQRQQHQQNQQQQLQAQQQSNHFTQPQSQHSSFSLSQTQGQGQGQGQGLGQGEYPYTHSRSHSHTLQTQKSQPQLRNKTVRHSTSINTISSTDSMPQLSSSVSNQSLDSPASLYYNTVTPRKIGRKKSLSVSSVNLYNTPMRGSSVPSSFSPVGGNAAALAASSQLQVNSGNGNGSSKVGKTPHSSRGHTRSRSSRLSIDAINTPFLMANNSTTLNGNGVTGGAGGTFAINTNAIPSYALQNLSINGNPFYTPSSFESPKLDDLSGDLENLDTPLATPSGSFVNLQNHNQNSFLSPAAAAKSWNATSASTNTLPGQQQQQQQHQQQQQIPQQNQYSTSSTYQYNAPINPNEGYITPLALQRNDTLDSIKIEDQDDDALKEIRKAKHQIMNSRKTTNINSNGIQDNSTGFDDDLFFNSTDFGTMKFDNEFQVQQNPNENTMGGSGGSNLISSHSTPGGIVVSSNSPPQNSFNSSTQTLSQSAMFPGSVQNTNSDFYVLSPQFVEPSNQQQQAQHAQKYQQNFPVDLQNDPPFRIDLDSIASVQSMYNNKPSSTPGSGYVVQSSGGSNTPSSSSSGTLLPPMATFNTSKLSTSKKSGPGNILSDNKLQNSTAIQTKIETKTDTPIDPKKKHPCPLCDSRFQRPEHVKRHLKSHSKEKPYECDEPDCGKRFNRKDNLKAHLKKIHQRL